MSLNLRLRYIQFDTDFRKSELTNFQVIEKRDLVNALKTDDCVCLVSKGEKMVQFVYGFRDVARPADRTRERPNVKVLGSIKLRIDGSGSWEPYMLANYAEAVGINLVGLKKFEEAYASRA